MRCSKQTAPTADQDKAAAPFSSHVPMADQRQGSARGPVGWQQGLAMDTPRPRAGLLRWVQNAVLRPAAQPPRPARTPPQPTAARTAHRKTSCTRLRIARLHTSPTRKSWCCAISFAPKGPRHVRPVSTATASGMSARIVNQRVSEFSAMAGSGQRPAMTASVGRCRRRIFRTAGRLIPATAAPACRLEMLDRQRLAAIMGSWMRRHSPPRRSAYSQAWCRRKAVSENHWFGSSTTSGLDFPIDLFTIVRARMLMSAVPNPDQLRDEWLKRLFHLIQTVQTWAHALGWSTRQIEVTLTDSQIGKYKAPALLLQEDAIRILLEPIGRSAPGAEGVVDLYLMPAYDDIASLYLYDNDWHVHYLFPGTSTVADIRDAEAKPLSEDTLREVLEAMKHNAVQQI